MIAPSAASLRRLVEQFPEPSYYVSLDDALDALRHESQFNVIDLEIGWKIDFIICKTQVADPAGISSARRDELDIDIERWVAELGVRSEWRAARDMAGADRPPSA